VTVATGHVKAGLACRVCDEMGHMQPYVAAVGAIVHDPSGRLLVVRRGRAPAMGLWSLPGGRVELGETDEEALSREVAEETGLGVSVGELVGSVVRPPYEIRDYACTVVSGDLHAGDDATDVRWVTLAELRGLPTTPGLLDALTSWSTLPR
jgi:8-oxo-dGTP diphosphatase